MKLLLSMVALLFATGARGTLDSELTGYKDSKFGSTKKQIETQVGALECLPRDSDVPANAICFRSAGFQLVGVPVTTEYWFLDNRLYRVTIALEFASDVDGETRHLKTLALHKALVDKYGSPDASEVTSLEPPAKDIRWNSPTGNTVIVLTIAEDEDSGLGARVSYNHIPTIQDYARRSQAASQKKRAETSQRL